MQEAHITEPTDEPSHAVVPIPGSLRSEPPRTPFWKRLSLRGTIAGLASPTVSDQVLARVDALASQLAGTEQRIEQLDQRFSEVWEVEEQLSQLMELHEILIEIQERQTRVETRMRSLGRRLSWVTFLSGTAAVAGLAAIALALL
jgi:hypothetical protein